MPPLSEHMPLRPWCSSCTGPRVCLNTYHLVLDMQDPKSGDFVKASSVQLRDRMRVSDEEAMRKACYEVCAAAPGAAAAAVHVVDRIGHGETIVE